MGTAVSVIYADLTVAYIEIRMFDRLPSLFSRDIVELFIKNYFRFLDDIHYKWKVGIDIQTLHNFLNNLHPDIKFVFETCAASVNFLDVKCNITNELLTFDIFHKPTHSFSYLHYKSCHPRHLKQNIPLSLGRRIIKIVTEDSTHRLQELMSHLMNQNYPEPVIDFSFSKLFSSGLFFSIFFST